MDEVDTMNEMDDEDEDKDEDEQFWERLKEEGTVIWSVEWDSGGPGGGGVETLYELDGVYWYPSDEGGLFGPYKTLAKAVSDTDLNMVNEAMVSFDSSRLSAAKVVALLEPVELKNGFIVLINGKPWVYVRPGRFRRAKQADMDRLEEE